MDFIANMLGDAGIRHLYLDTIPICADATVAWNGWLALICRRFFGCRVARIAFAWTLWPNWAARGPEPGARKRCKKATIPIKNTNLPQECIPASMFNC